MVTLRDGDIEGCVCVGGDSGKDYPLQKKKHSLEFLRSIAHLRPRSNTFGYTLSLPEPLPCL